MEIDLLRLLFAFFCGYFLAISGSLSQVTSHNHLASPSTLGMDGLAVVTVILSQGILVLLGVEFPLEHLSFALFILCFFGVFVLSKGLFRFSLFETDMQGIILLGLAFNLLVGAVFSVVQFLFMALNFEFPTGLWFGNFRFYSLSYLWLFVLAFIVTLLCLSKLAPKLRIMTIGNEFAQGCGINISKIQKQSLLLSLFLTGLVICYFGVFSFLSLIFPHLLRMVPVFRKNMRHELYYGPFLCGIALSFLDALCFHFDFRGAELPVGMVSSILGSFLLIGLLLKSRLKNFAK